MVNRSTVNGKEIQDTPLMTIVIKVCQTKAKGRDTGVK